MEREGPKTGVWKIGFILIITLLCLHTQFGAITGTEAAEENTLPPKQDIWSVFQKLPDHPVVNKGAKGPFVYAKAFVLADADTGEVIVEKNAELELPVASTTKMTTALVVKQSLPLSEVVTVPTVAVQTIGSTVNLVKGEKITVHNLLKALLIQSGNDAAVALAEHYRLKTGQDFVAAMNDYLRERGINQSAFRDPSGLNDEQGRSTAFDLAHIGRLLLADPDLSAIVATAETTVNSVDGLQSHLLKNSNRLVSPTQPLYLPGALGIKTGFTPEAGHCLVSAYKLGDRKVVSVVLNTNEFTVSASAAETRKLFLWAAANVAWESY